MPGVSMIQPWTPSSPGSGSMIADVEVCRPRPVTALTCPIARSASGTSALTSVDFPTPLWPISTLVRPERRSVSSVRSPPFRVTTHGTPRGR